MLVHKPPFSSAKNTPRPPKASDVIERLGGLSDWFATNMKAFRKNTQSQIIIYDILDCTTDLHCPNRGSKKPAKKMKP